MKADRSEPHTKVPRRLTFAASTVEHRGEKRSDPEGGHEGEDVVTKSRAIEDTGEEPSEMSSHKLEMIRGE